MSLITRKISIRINESDKELKANYYSLLMKWLHITHKASNFVSNHLYVMDNTKDLIYFTDEVKAKLADNSKVPDGILNTSYQNSTYRLLSSMFKGEIPSDILTNINSTISSTYKKEKTEYFKGTRSLRSYKTNVPIPFSSKSLTIHDNKDSYGNYSMSLFNIPLITYFGKDRSNNKSIFIRILNGEYKVRASSIQYVNKTTSKFSSWYLLLVIDIPDKTYNPIPDTAIYCNLSIYNPIIATHNKTSKKIGYREEFLYQRLQIQKKLSRLQKELKYASGGSGRKNKLQAINRFNKKEKNYIQTKLHTYSRELVDFAIKNNAEKIILYDQFNKVKQAHSDLFVLRNWSYYGLIKLIEYKAAQYNIPVIIEKKEKHDNSNPFIKVDSNISNITKSILNKFGNIAWPDSELHNIIPLIDQYKDDESSLITLYLISNEPSFTILRLYKDDLYYTDIILSHNKLEGYFYKVLSNYYTFNDFYLQYLVL